MLIRLLIAVESKYGPCVVRLVIHSSMLLVLTPELPNNHIALSTGSLSSLESLKSRRIKSDLGSHDQRFNGFLLPSTHRLASYRRCLTRMSLWGSEVDQYVDRTEDRL